VTRRCAALVAVLLAAPLAPRRAGAEDAPAPPRPAKVAPVYLLFLDVESPAGLDLRAPLSVRLELHPGRAEKAKSLREWFPDAAESGEAVTIALPPGGGVATAPPAAAERRPSWFVDADDPAVVALREALGPVSPRDGPAAIARLVGRHIERKDLERLLDRASTVAVRREGDCTEHAVLTAAVARAAGLAARVVFGVALVAGDAGRVYGLGHAWAEVHDGRHWQISDATGLEADRVRYLPLGVLRDEGPGYVIGAWSVLSPLDVKRVVLAAGR
jgi:transglutaminase-like putative cysteine protease